MSEEALIRAFAASLFEADAPEAIAGDVTGYFVRHGVPAEAAAGLPPIAAERLAIYRRMVHSRLRDVITEFLPKSVARLGRTRLSAELGNFLADVSPRSPYFRRVAGEFVDWARGRWPADASLPPYLLALADYEWINAEVSDRPAGGAAAAGDSLALDRPVQFDGTTTLRRYDWAVHRAEETGDLVAESTALLLYRDRTEHRVRVLELTPRAAAVCTRLLAGEPLQAALMGACAELEQPLDDELLAAMASFFADLADRGVLLGAA